MSHISRTVKYAIQSHDQLVSSVELPAGDIALSVQ